MLDNLPEWLKYLSVIFLIVASYIVTGRWLARALFSIVGETDTNYDDIVVKRLKPRRVALLAPLAVMYLFSYLIPYPEAEKAVSITVYVIGLWLLILTGSGLLDAINDIYESRRDFSGVSIKGYFDLITILFVALGVIITISLITGESPLVLLAGVGALMAVLLLIFRDTILSLVASVQISTNDLIKEGDWVEVPSYNADGDVIDISLHQIKVQNFDKTISYVPTYKLTEGAFKNWRGMSDSGGRRIKRSIYIDAGTIHFCDMALVEQLQEIYLIRDYVERITAESTPQEPDLENEFSSLAGDRRLTNIGAFRNYIIEYLRHHPHIREDMSLVVRAMSPSPEGLPIEIYAFTNTIIWAEYEKIQAEIFDHLLAVVPDFDLRVFQQPSGADFAKFTAGQ